jgi:AraC-like DNA-binding protein
MAKSTPKTPTTHFAVNGHAQDRIKIPAGFWTRMKSAGLSPAAILRHSGLPATAYGGENATRVTTRQLFALWRAVRDLSGDPTLGWKGISQYPTDQFQPPLLAAFHARTFRDCIERLARYKKLCGSEEFRLTSHGDEVRIEISWPFADGEPVAALLLDAVFALIAELGRRGTKTRLNPQRLELARPREKENPLEDYFGCPVKYRAPRNAYVLRATDLDLPFVTHNEELLQVLSPDNGPAQGAGRGDPNVRDQVRWVLKRLLAGSRPDLAMVAKELGMGERTLQRRITAEGTSFRQLINETRRALVREYLDDASVEISEAAFLIGFEDPNSFYRAFRTWEGKTPSEWRAARQRS